MQQIFFSRNLRLILIWFEHFKQQTIQKNQHHLLSNYPFFLSIYLFLKNLQTSRTFLHVVLTRIFAMAVHFLQFWLKKSFWEISIDRSKDFDHIYAENFCRNEKHYQDWVLKMRSSKVIAKSESQLIIFSARSIDLRNKLIRQVFLSVQKLFSNFSSPVEVQCWFELPWSLQNSEDFWQIGKKTNQSVKKLPDNQPKTGKCCNTYVTIR